MHGVGNYEVNDDIIEVDKALKHEDELGSGICRMDIRPYGSEAVCVLWILDPQRPFGPLPAALGCGQGQGGPTHTRVDRRHATIESA